MSIFLLGYDIKNWIFLGFADFTKLYKNIIITADIIWVGDREKKDDPWIAKTNKNWDKSIDKNYNWRR